MKSPGSPTVDDYLAGVPAEARTALENLRAQIKDSAPGAEEVISYGIPTFRYDGRPLVAISAHDKHCSLHLMSPPLMDAIKGDLRAHKTTAATIRFTPDEPLPDSLVMKLVKARIAENNVFRTPGSHSESKEKKQ